MLKALSILLFCFALAIIGWWFFRTDPTITVTVINPQRGRIESVIRVTGKVINDRTVTLTALVDGQIQSMQVQKGDQVKAGQVLALLDEREANALLNKAKAEQKRELQAVNEARRKLKRVRDLSKSGHAAIQLLEDTQAEWLSSQARLQVARANLAVARIHREKTQISAPFAGVITGKTTEVGQWLEAGEALFTLVALDGREIEVNVDAGDSSAIHLQQPITLSCDAYPGREWHERVHWIAPAISKQAEQAVNTFAVHMTLSDSAPHLLLNQQVDARILTAERNDVLKLPFEALNEDADQRQVAIIEAGHVRWFPVETGIEDFTHVEIVTGIDETSQVILLEGKTLQNGQSVQINTEAK